MHQRVEYSTSSQESDDEKNFRNYNQAMISTPPKNSGCMDSNQSPDTDNYSKKIQSIWANIERTKMIESSSDQPECDISHRNTKSQIKSKKNPKHYDSKGEFSMQKNISLLNSKQKATYDKSYNQKYQKKPLLAVSPTNDNFECMKIQKNLDDSENHHHGNFSFTTNHKKQNQIKYGQYEWQDIEGEISYHNQHQNQRRRVSFNRHTDKVKKTLDLQIERHHHDEGDNDSDSQLITDTNRIEESYKNSVQKQAERELKKSKENTNILMKKLIEADEQINYLEKELENEVELRLSREEENSKLNKEIMSKGKENQFNQFNHQSREGIVERQTLNKENKDLTMKVERLQLKADSLQRERQIRNGEIENLLRQNQQLLKTAQQTEMLSHPSQQNWRSQIIVKESKSSQLLELEQAYQTIERLLSLLKSTNQFKGLAHFAEQVKGIHFLKKIQKKVVSTKLGMHGKPTCKSISIKLNENLLWAPTLCYKKMLEMKIKYDSLTEDCIEEVLFEMNKLYLSKEQTRVSKIKSQHESELTKLKKKAQQSYNQVLAKKQIERLKKQLTAKKNGHYNQPKKIGRSGVSLNLGSNSNETNMMERIKMIGQYEDEIRLKDREIKLLQQRVKLIESQTGTNDKDLYFEGVIWIIDRVLEQLDGTSEEVQLFQSSFRQKITHAESAEDWLMCYKEFFESIEELNNNLVEKVISMKESTLAKMVG